MVTIPAVLLLVIALVLFLLEAFSIKVGAVGAGWLGLAFVAAAMLWPHFVKVGGG